MTLRSPPLFWRTLLLVLLLIIASLAAWLQSFRVFERAPRAETIAQQVVSIAQLTRAALLYADPYVRRDLLAELASNEGIRIFPLERTDKVVPLPDRPILRMASASIIDKLGAGTQVAAAVNGVTGMWVSLTIDEDRYWLFIDRDPVARNVGTQWIGWAAVAVALSVLGAILITRVINRPLARLSNAARELGEGRTPAPLPAVGPAEIRTVNESFNRMVTDLGKLEEDRAVLLAGISHDLRTPLTRLRLEIEMADLQPETRGAMVGDLEQMDAIVRQFLDYARRSPQQPAERIDLSTLVEAAVDRARIDAQAHASVNLLVAHDVTHHRIPHRARPRARQSARECGALRARSGLGPARPHRFAVDRRTGRRPGRRRSGARCAGRADRSPAAPVRARRGSPQRQRRRGAGAADRAADCASARRQPSTAGQCTARTARRTDAAAGARHVSST